MRRSGRSSRPSCCGPRRRWRSRARAARSPPGEPRARREDRRPAVPPTAGAANPTTKGFIAFEPMGGVTNALNLAQKGIYKELQMIPVGGSWEERFWITTKGY